MTLFEETLKMLRADKRSAEALSRETGLGREWLTKLRSGHIKEPGVIKIQKLNDFLKSEQPA